MDAEEYKQFEREAYNKVATAWAANMAGPMAVYGRRLLELLAPAPGMRLLDLACGAGHLVVDAALHYHCRAAGLDISEGMLEQARLRAAGVPGVEFQRGDAENLPFPDASFDLVTSCFGLMYFPNTERVLAGIRRVLVPGGRVGFVVWALAPRAAALRVTVTAFAEVAAPGPAKYLVRLPLVGERILFRAIEEELRGKGPSPFRFGRLGKIERVLTSGGFTNVQVTDHTAVWRFAGFEVFWEHFVRSTPAQAEQHMPREVVAEIYARLARKAERYRDSGGLAFPMTALLVHASRP